VQFDRAGKTGKVEITIDATSINSGTPRSTSTCKALTCSTAAEHPTARFVADKFSFNGDKVSEVSRQLTLLGKTHP
jgi:polyisoprenoid-binding protein YceI